MEDSQSFYKVSNHETKERKIVFKFASGVGNLIFIYPHLIFLSKQ